MAEEIRGLSVKFDADFSEFRKGMKEADKDINSTQRQMKNLQSSLKMDFDAKKFTQAQQQAQKALDATDQKANLLRQRLEEMESAGITNKTRDEYNYLQEQLAKTELQAQQLQKQLEELDNIRLDSLTKGIDNVADKASKAASATKGLSIAAAGLVTGIAALGVSAYKTGAEIDDLAQRSGLSAEKMQEWQYVAAQTGISQEKLVTALIKARAAYADLGTGNINKQTQALEALGIAYGSLDNEQLFDAVISGLSGIADRTLQVAYANEIFGDRTANELLPMLNAGADAINQFKSEFAGFESLSNEQVAAMAIMDDEIFRMSEEFKNLKLQLGVELMPLFKDIVHFIEDSVVPAVSDIVHWFGSLDKGTQKFILTGLLLIASLSPMLKLFSGITGGVSKLIHWFGKLDVATLKLYGKWALLLAAVGTLFAVLANWEKMNPVQRIIALFGALSAVALAAAVAFGVFHSAWSLGLAVAGIVAGIAAAIAAVNSAADDINADVSFDAGTYSSAVTGGGEIPSYDIPSYSASGASGDTYTNTSSNDTYNVTIVVDGSNLSADEIAEAVSKKIATLSQSRR